MEYPVTPPAVEAVRLWDPLLRIFHWSLALCVAAAWGLGQFGPDRMTLHFFFGYAVIGLLAFRLVWAIVGPVPARFGGLLHAPRSILRYAWAMGRRQPSGWRGHNPLGGLFVIVLLGVLALQTLTGLIADPEDYMNVGPLAAHVPTALTRTALAWHAILATALLGLVALHLAAIAFYRLWKHEDLVRPMITGQKLCLPATAFTPAE